MKTQKFRCLKTDSNEHNSRTEARVCCGSTDELWGSGECDSIYDTEDEAETCCTKEAA